MKNMNELSPHQQRVLNEKLELDEKINKLDAFFTTAVFRGLPGDEQFVLFRQIEAMRFYTSILEERIAGFFRMDYEEVRQEEQKIPAPPAAPRVTEEALRDNIASIEVLKHTTKSGQILRWAVLNTKSGFAVTGRPSAAVSPANDNAQLGEETAIRNAEQELWVLMGYALKERLAA
jgi:hypothetical protein